MIRTGGCVVHLPPKGKLLHSEYLTDAHDAEVGDRIRFLLDGGTRATPIEKKQYLEDTTVFMYRFPKGEWESITAKEINKRRDVVVE